jgi:hypothetical protein
MAFNANKINIFLSLLFSCQPFIAVCLSRGSLFLHHRLRQQRSANFINMLTLSFYFTDNTLPNFSSYTQLEVIPNFSSLLN